MINLKNYETYALDYLEGNLDAVQVSQMEAFLSQHPEIKSEFDDMSDLVYLEPATSISYANKDTLYRKEEAVVVKLFRTNFFKMGIAASILLGFSAFFILNNQSNTDLYANIDQAADQVKMELTEENKTNTFQKKNEAMAAQEITEQTLPVEEVDKQQLSSTRNTNNFVASNSDVKETITTGKQIKANQKIDNLDQIEQDMAIENLVPEKRAQVVFASLSNSPIKPVSMSERPVLTMTLPTVDQSQIDRFGLNTGIARLEKAGLWSEVVNEGFNINDVKGALIPEGGEEAIAVNTNDVTNTNTFQSYLTDLKDALLPESMVSALNK